MNDQHDEFPAEAVAAAEPETAAVLPELAAAFPEATFTVVERAGAAPYVEAAAERARLAEFVAAAQEQGYVMFVDVCAVDYLRRKPRFDVVVTLLSRTAPHRLLVKVGVPEDDPVVPSVTSVYPGANFYEREAFDLFGITFSGHPDLTRILMPDDWEGHPLRKDYGVGSVPVQFKEAFRPT